MFYEKKRKIAAPRRLTHRLNVFGGIDTSVSENILTLTRSAGCYNVTAGNGALRENKGVRRAEFTTVDGRNYLMPDFVAPIIANMFYYRRYDSEVGKILHYIVAKTCEGNLYSYCLSTAEGFVMINDYDLGEIYATDNYRTDSGDVLLISAASGFYMLNDTTLTEVENAPTFSSVCVHYERVFGTMSGDGNRLWFSESLNPTNWKASAEEGGYIDFADDGGRLVKVLSFNNYVYIFREYAIFRLAAYSEQSEFLLTKVYSSAGRINCGSICICGDYIIFQAENAFYRFDGSDTVRIMRECDELKIGGNFGASAWFKGRYYLALNVNYDDGEKVLNEKQGYIFNTLLEYSPVDKTVDLTRGVDICNLLPLNLDGGSKLIVNFHNSNHDTFAEIYSGGKYMDDVMPKFWRTGKTDLGYPEKKKILRKITVITGYDCEVGVIADGVESVYPARAGFNELRVNRSFNKLALFFRTNGEKIDISNPALTVDYL